MPNDNLEPPRANKQGIYNGWSNAKERVERLSELNERHKDDQDRRHKCIGYITVETPCTLEFDDLVALWEHVDAWHRWEVYNETNFDAMYRTFLETDKRPALRQNPANVLQFNHLDPGLLKMTAAELAAVSLAASLSLPSQAQATPIYGSQATSITTHPAQEHPHHTHVSLTNNADRKLPSSMMQPLTVHGPQVMSHPQRGQPKYDATQKWQPQSLQTTPVAGIQTARSTDRFAHGHVQPMYKMDPGSCPPTQQIAPVHGPQTYQNTRYSAQGIGQSTHGAIESQPRIAWDSGLNADSVPSSNDSSLPATSHPRTHGSNHRIPSTDEGSNSVVSANDLFDAHWAQVNHLRQAPLPDSSDSRTHGLNHRIPNTSGTSDASMSTDDLFDAHWAQVKQLGQPALPDNSRPHTHTQGHWDPGHHTFNASSVHPGVQSPMTGTTEQLQKVHVSSPGQISNAVVPGHFMAQPAAGYDYPHSGMHITTNSHHKPHDIYNSILAPMVHSPPSTVTGHVPGPSRVQSRRSEHRDKPYPTGNAGPARRVHSDQVHHDPAQHHQGHQQ